MTELPMAELQRTSEISKISKIIMDLEPLADIYERHGTGSFKVCFELLAEYRALKSRLLENQLQELKLSDVYRRTFPGTFVGDRNALLKVAPDEDP